MFLRNLLVLLAVLFLASPAQAWWDSEWTARQKITIDTAAPEAAISEAIGSTVVLVRLHDGNFQFAAAKDDGSDIRFLAEDEKTQLSYHIERFDSLLNEAFLWVKIPEIKPGAKTVLWLYYGNTGPKATRVEDAKAVFDAPTALVYHFAEKTGPAGDASGKGNAAQNAVTAVTGSLIGGGVRFDGRTPITVPASESLAWSAGSPVTISTWVKPGAPAAQAVVLSRREGAKSIVLGVDSGAPFIEVNDGAAPQRGAAGAPLAANAWHHLAVVAEAGKMTLYVDGESAATVAAALPALNGPLLIGGDSVEGATGFVGDLDELVVAKIARPAGWVKFVSLSEGASDKAGKLVATAADEHSSSSGSEGYMGTIIKSLTVDGWVVICILGVMAVISWYVMVTKIGYLNGISKGNALFMKEWGHVASDLTILDHGGDAEKTKSLGGRVDKKGQRAMRQSSVYRIYHIGVEEIRHRLAADHNDKILSARSIQSIRARLDGGLVREKQGIDKLIVLLTICISGGPFLGLLGTVVGVMITFAAVAAAGDVNVNAIAPGIAAALLATVAGLAVAIPSLFGYNYILARVKDATADMHVFIDEFISRMAEFYSEPPLPLNAARHHRVHKETELAGAAH